MHIEKWREIDFGKYMVSSKGRVINLSEHHGAKLFVKTRPNNRGYVEAGLCAENKKRYFLVHRLMAKAFLNKQKHHTEVNHLNGIKNDNRLENLEWTTRSANELHRARVLKKGIGTLNGNSKLTKEDVLEIRELYKNGVSRKEIAALKKTGTSQIHRIVNRIHWSHV
jgi:hypothetical protein